MKRKYLRWSTGSSAPTVPRAGPFPGWCLWDKQGGITEWFGTARDITERKLIEERLRETTGQADQQKKVYETISPDLIYVFPPDYRFT